MPSSPSGASGHGKVQPHLFILSRMSDGIEMLAFHMILAVDMINAMVCSFHYAHTQIQPADCMLCFSQDAGDLRSVPCLKASCLETEGALSLCGLLLPI